MVHPTYKKQEEIKKKIRGYLGPPGESGKTWSELKKKAEADGLSPTTLSRYLKDGENEGSIRRNVKTESHPPTVIYGLNMPSTPSKREAKEILEKQLALHAKYAAKGEHAAIGYYDKFIWILFDMIAIHVWASRFRNPKVAGNWIRVATEMMLNDWYNLGQEAPILLKHREAVQASARDYLVYFLNRFPKGRLERQTSRLDAKFIEDYLAFDPVPGLRQEM